MTAYDATGQIARFVEKTGFESVPSQAVDTAKTAFIDCLGVALAGSREESARIAAGMVRHQAAREETAVIAGGFRTSVLDAAFANGIAAHALDFDHSFGNAGQANAPLVPAAFSLAVALGADGRRLLEAYIVGFEVAAKLAIASQGSTNDAWHAPGVLGAIGATAASAKLLGLDEPRSGMALGIVASMASGIEANFGTMTKPLHVGHAARNGILAAKLAAAGFTANPNAIEAATGFFRAHYGMELLEEHLAALGRAYELVETGLRIKPYPSGGLAHSAIDAMLALREELALAPEAIESIDVDVIKRTADRISFGIPRTGLEGKFSMAYVIARAAMDGRVSLAAFTDEAVRDPRVLAVAERVHMRVDPSLVEPGDQRRPSRVTVHLKDGQAYTRRVDDPRGSPESPLTPDQLRDKFLECARQAVPEAGARQILDSLEHLETLDDLTPLSELLAG